MEAVNRLKAPASTTITWASLAGLGSTFFWGMIDTFTEVEPSATLVSGSTAFFAALVGKLVTEKRYDMKLKEGS